MPIRTLLVVGLPGLPVAALAATLRLVPRLTILGPVTDVATLGTYIPSNSLDVILAEWPDQQSLLRQVVDAVRCRHLCPALVLVGEQLEVCELAAMRALGIAGYLSWADLDPMTMRSAIRAAIGGYFVLGANVAGLSPRSLLPHTACLTPAPLLTQREHDVLRGLCAGMSEQQLATSEGISTRTVKRTVKVLKAKLGVASLSALAMRAERLGLTSPARPARGNQVWLPRGP
jgi:DNA-binding NarL/FixJ family response regulator